MQTYIHAMIATFLIASAAIAAPQQRRAMAGDTVLLKGQLVHIEGVICPNPSQPNGRIAKELTAAYLRQSAITCSYTPIGDKSYGDCQSKTDAFPSLRNTLLQSNLCTLECSGAAGSKYPCA